MGGVDLLDSFMGRYKINLKGRNWYMRISYHLLDISVVNAWLLYKLVLLQKQTGCKVKNQGQFRVEVAYTFCNV